VWVEKGPFVNFANVSPARLGSAMHGTTHTITTAKTYHWDTPKITAIGIMVGTVVDSYLHNVFCSSSYSNAQKYHGVQISFEAQHYWRLMAIFGDKLNFNQAYATMDEGGPLFATCIEYTNYTTTFSGKFLIIYFL
jgi:hypothetical protein